MKEITILLTKHNDLVSTIIYWFCGFKYNHSSISLEDNPKQFYSFNKKGNVHFKYTDAKEGKEVLLFTVFS